ncbi:MAG: DUF4142 domain-containing protein [Marinoscillum sp.]
MLYILSLPLLLFGCQSKTYYQAMNTNQQRFGGTRLVDAEFLNESHDQIRLIEVMTVTAMERSVMKETYIRAKETHRITEQVTKKHEFEALKHRIKLASTLSTSKDSQLQKLYEVSDDHFDIVYMQQMQKQLSELILSLKQYIESGTDLKLVAFSNDTLIKIEKMARELTIYSYS